MSKTHKEITHRWAQRRADYSARGYAIIAEGLNLYSYGHHYLLGRHVQDVHGNWQVLINNTPSSVSTAKHRSYARRAVPGHYFEVGNPAANDYGTHLDNLQGMVAEAQGMTNKSNRARTNKAFWAEQAAAQAKLARCYAEAFGLPLSDADNLYASIQELNAARAAIWEREKAEREARELARKLEAQERDKAAFEEWLAGGYHCPASYYTDADGFAYIRKARTLRDVSENGSYVLETSQGASVPWAHAVKAFQFIKLCRATGQAFKTNGRVIRVGHYKVDWIDEQGNFKAGCHKFKWAEIERLALREGVFDAPMSSEAVEERAHV